RGDLRGRDPLRDAGERIPAPSGSVARGSSHRMRSAGAADPVIGGHHPLIPPPRRSPMSSRFLLRTGVLLLGLTLMRAAPATAQTQSVIWTLNGGALLPFSTFGEYFGTMGATAGVGAAYPLNERLDVTLDVGLDMVNR